MCWIDHQSKKLVHLKHLILQIFKHFIPFSLYSVGILILCTLKALSPVFLLTGYEKKNVIFVTLTFTAFFLNIFSIDLLLFQIEALKGIPI